MSDAQPGLRDSAAAATADAGAPAAAGAAPGARERRARLVVTALAFAAAAIVPPLVLADPVQVRAAIVAAVVLALWLAEALPPFVPTLLLVAAVPLALGDVAPAYGLRAVLGWCADPVLALFLGGFALGAAAAKHGVDAVVARAVVRASRGRAVPLVALCCLGTAALSMWMSNIAAAAMMIAALRPILAATSPPDTDPSSSGDVAARSSTSGVRRALLVAVAFGANFGGMATPIGSGPNAIALSRAPSTSFIEWMLIAAPLTLGLLLASVVLVVVRGRVRGRIDVVVADAPLARRGAAVFGVFAICVAAWLAEPLHGIDAPTIALATAAALFATGLLEARDLTRIDWSTLILVAGGLALGRLLETAGLIAAAADAVPWDALPALARLVVILTAAALFSALASNTATATMLIPLAVAIDPSPAMPILVAIACSLGAPFVFSTPPNAMAAGAGARSSDLLFVGLPLMIGGAIFVGLTGGAFVALFFP